MMTDLLQVAHRISNLAYKAMHNDLSIVTEVGTNGGVVGLVLLAAFPKPSGDPCMQCGALMELWSAWGWQNVAV